MIPIQHKREQALRLTRCLGALLCGLAVGGIGQAAPSATITDVYTAARRGQTNQVEWGDWLLVKVSGLSPEQQSSEGADKSKWVLYLNETPLPGLCADVSMGTPMVLSFHLRRTDATRSSWASLLGAPRSFNKALRVSVGLEGKSRLPVASGHTGEITFVVIRPGWFWFCLVASALLVAAVLFLARRTQALRDDGPLPPTKDGLRPYSLARCQMAFWFILVIPGFLLLWLITGALDTLTESILVLMGVSASTAIFTHAQYGTKQKECALGKLLERQRELGIKTSLSTEEQEELEKLQRKIEETTPHAIHFMTDILTDDVGMSFHRFQMFVWTLVMGVVYVVETYQKLAMPDFSGTLLGLMGISSGTYLGFMLTEPASKQSPAKPPPPSSTP